MERRMFIAIATRALQRLGDPEAKTKASVIADELDAFAELMDEPPATPPLPHAPPAETWRTALESAVVFPPAHPAAVHQAPPAAPEDRSGWYDPAAEAEVPAPVIEPPPIPYTPGASDNRIIPATSIPDNVRRTVDPPAAAPVRSLRDRPAMRKKLTVEDLNLAIQQRTPPFIVFDVPLENGQMGRATYDRNVISRHAEDSVQLVYFPQNAATQSGRDATSVMKAIHLQDMPIDLAGIVKSLTMMAIDACRPKPPVMSVTPPRTSGPVFPNARYEDGSSMAPAVEDAAACLARQQ